MSELKAIDDLYERRIRNGSDPYKIKLVDVRHPPVYLKSEADNVISELKDEASTAHRVCSRQIQQIASNEQEIRHQKYKRCLNKAEWCEERCARYDALQERTGFSWRREIDFYFRWYQRWMELAEKFKEAK